MSGETRIEFKGTGLQALGWGSIAVILSTFIIPAAWGAVVIYRWFVKNLAFSDGTQASFEGRGKQMWGYFILAILLGFTPLLSRDVKNPATSFFVFWALYILVIAVDVAIYLKILRWFFSNIRLSCGTQLSFEGGYFQYLGWMLLIILSVFTIIGWAWVAVAMLRWLFKNIKGDDHHLVFLETGWGLLWRCCLAGMASFFIVPIPWVTVWLIRWFVKNTQIRQSA